MTKLPEIPRRSSKQNNALHKMFELLADEMNAHGLTTKKVITLVADLPMDKELVKRLIWKPIQIAQVDKEHTSNLTTIEVDKIFEVVNKMMAESPFNLHVDFPKIETVMKILK